MTDLLFALRIPIIRAFQNDRISDSTCKLS
jgi:hypothetical protein